MPVRRGIAAGGLEGVRFVRADAVPAAGSCTVLVHGAAGSDEGFDGLGGPHVVLAWWHSWHWIVCKLSSANIIVSRINLTRQTSQEVVNLRVSSIGDAR